ncbi:MAG TPA: hypothetical protein VFR09_06970 [Alphaproteobacteria bacterium]|nr:hypothetical protein [Alphaproteobacteria bacterium]
MALEFVGRAVVAGGIADMGLLAGGIATAATATGIGAVAIGAVAFLGDFYLNYRKTDSVSEAFNLTIQDAGKLGKFMLDAVVNVGKDVWNAAKNVFSNPSDIPGTAFKLVDFLTVGGATAVQQAFKGNFMPAADWITLGGASLAVTVYHGAKWAMENPKQAEALAGKVIKGVEDALSFAWSVVSDPKLAHDVANTTTNAAIAAHDADSGDRLASAAQTAWNDRRQLTADVQHNATGVVHHGAQVIRLATDNNASAAAVFSALPSLGAMPSLTATMTADNDATPVRPTDLTRGAYAPQARAA